jgi:arylformamidase
MGYLYLSYHIQEKSPVYIGLKPPSIRQECQVSTEGYNTSIISVENHSGTHVDAPGHFLEDGKTISDYTLEEMVFRKVLILECSKGSNELINVSDLYAGDLVTETLKNADSILIRTGFSQYRTNDIKTYLTQNPGISPDLIQHIRKNFHNIRALGIDCISISPYGDPDLAIETHHAAFIPNENTSDENYGEPLLLIEDMKLQNILRTDIIKKLFLVPWQIRGIDSAPCSVIAHLK